MSTHKRLGIDVDGVLAAFAPAYEQRIVEVTGRDLFWPKPFTPDRWHYPEHLGYTAGEMKAVWDSIRQDQGFWRLLPRYDGVDDTVLLRGWSCTGNHSIYFVTTRVGESAKWQTERWFKDWWGEEFAATILITRNKPYAAVALELDVFIDDYHQNTQQLALSVPACHTYLLNRPWNANEFAGLDVVRVDTLEEMFVRESL